MASDSKKPSHTAFVVETVGEKDYFTEIGAAWPLKNGGYRLRLRALPVGNEILILPTKTKEAE